MKHRTGYLVTLLAQDADSGMNDETIGDVIKIGLNSFFRNERLLFRLAFYLFMGLVVHVAYGIFSGISLVDASYFLPRVVGITLGIIYGTVGLSHYRQRVVGNFYFEGPRPSAWRRPITVVLFLMFVYSLIALMHKLEISHSIFSRFVGIPITALFPFAIAIWIAWLLRYEKSNGYVYVRQGNPPLK